MGKRQATLIELARLYGVLDESSDRLIQEIDATPVAVHAVIECLKLLRSAMNQLEGGEKKDGNH